MNANFDTPARCSASGVTTACILVLILAMAASTLFAPEAPANDAGVTATQVAGAHQPSPIKKS